MGVYTIHSRYTFGDEVQYHSPYGSGNGKLFAIVVDDLLACVSYMIEIEKGHYTDLEGGITPSDIVEDPSKRSNLHALTIRTKYQFGDLVRFDSVNGKGTGKVHEIMLDRYGEVSYVIDINAQLQPGIYESEIQAKIDQDRESKL